MNQYIDRVLKKEKKAVSMEKIVQQVEKLYLKENFGKELSMEDKKKIVEEIQRRVDTYQVYKTPNDQYILLSKTSFRVGRFVGNSSGSGIVFVTNSFVDKEGRQVVLEEKFPINQEYCQGVIDGDIVLIDKNYKKDTSKIVSLIERNLSNLTGEVVREGNVYLLKPFDKKLRKLYILLKGDNLIEGEYVSVSLEKTRESNCYIGEVSQVFRHKDDPHEEVYLAAFRCGMPEGFSEESLEQLKHIKAKVDSLDKVGRVDFTDWEIFSIDGADTKDKDDCISFKKLPNGHFLLASHIADTGAYVPTNSPIHKDAFRKGNSYYFGGSVEPQYPRKLSNGICSLHDGVERLTKSVIVEYDQNYNVVDKKLVKGVINSRLGMTYEQVNKLFNGEEVSEKYLEFSSTLRDLEKFTWELRKKRFANGALLFERPELKFIYDENGNPIKVIERNMGIAERIIEECMIASNVAVAEIMTENGIPCVYRVHGMPNVKHLEEFLELLNIIGLPYRYGATDICTHKYLLQDLVNHLSKAGDFASVLTTQLIRCMDHAEYSTTNTGHFGTGNSFYVHFTSPIRRLADDTISRILDDCYFEEDEQKRKQAIKRWKKIAGEYALQATLREKLADKVEKTVKELDTVRYLESHVGETFEGFVVSVQNGLTVQLDNSLEGRVRIRNLPGDYELYKEYHTLVSLDGYDNYCLGDRLKLLLVGTNRDTRVVDFKVVEKVSDCSMVNEDFQNSYSKSHNKCKKKYKNI